MFRCGNGSTGALGVITTCVKTTGFTLLSSTALIPASTGVKSWRYNPSFKNLGGLTLLISDSAPAWRWRVAAHWERGVPALPRGVRRQVPGGGDPVRPAHQAAPVTRVPPARADMRGHVSRVQPRVLACTQSDHCEASRVTHVSSLRITSSQETKTRIIHTVLQS